MTNEPSLQPMPRVESNLTAPDTQNTVMSKLEAFEEVALRALIRRGVLQPSQSLTPDQRDCIQELIQFVPASDLGRFSRLMKCWAYSRDPFEALLPMLKRMRDENCETGLSELLASDFFVHEESGIEPLGDEVVPRGPIQDCPWRVQHEIVLSALYPTDLNSLNRRIQSESVSAALVLLADSSSPGMLKNFWPRFLVLAIGSRSEDPFRIAPEEPREHFCPPDCDPTLDRAVIDAWESLTSFPLTPEKIEKHNPGWTPGTRPSVLACGKPDVYVELSRAPFRDLSWDAWKVLLLSTAPVEAEQSVRKIAKTLQHCGNMYPPDPGFWGSLVLTVIDKLFFRGPPFDPDRDLSKDIPIASALVATVLEPLLNNRERFTGIVGRLKFRRESFKALESHFCTFGITPTVFKLIEVDGLKAYQGNDQMQRLLLAGPKGKWDGKIDRLRSYYKKLGELDLPAKLVADLNGSGSRDNLAAMGILGASNLGAVLMQLFESSQGDTKKLFIMTSMLRLLQDFGRSLPRGDRNDVNGLRNIEVQLRSINGYFERIGTQVLPLTFLSYVAARVGLPLFAALRLHEGRTASKIGWADAQVPPRARFPQRTLQFLTQYFPIGHGPNLTGVTLNPDDFVARYEETRRMMFEGWRGTSGMFLKDPFLCEIVFNSMGIPELDFVPYADGDGVHSVRSSSLECTKNDSFDAYVPSANYHHYYYRPDRKVIHIQDNPEQAYDRGCDYFLKQQHLLATLRGLYSRTQADSKPGDVVIPLEKREPLIVLSVAGADLKPLSGESQLMRRDITETLEPHLYDERSEPSVALSELKAALISNINAELTRHQSKRGELPSAQLEMQAFRHQALESARDSIAAIQDSESMLRLLESNRLIFSRVWEDNVAAEEIRRWLTSKGPDHLFPNLSHFLGESELAMQRRITRVNLFAHGLQSAWIQQYETDPDLKKIIRKLFERFFKLSTLNESQALGGAQENTSQIELMTYASKGIELRMMGLICNTCVVGLPDPSATRANLAFFPFAEPGAKLPRPLLHGGAGVLGVSTVNHGKALLLRGVNPSQLLHETVSIRSLLRSFIASLVAFGKRKGFDCIIVSAEKTVGSALTNSTEVAEYFAPYDELVTLEHPESAKFNDIDVGSTCRLVCTIR